MSDMLPRGLIKWAPHTFVVQELLDTRNGIFPVPFEKETRITGSGNPSRVTLFNMTKQGVETEVAIHEVARQIGVPAHRISCHGLKDKHAYTTQCIGVSGNFSPTFSHRQIFLRQLAHQTHHPLRLSGHHGNRFVIEVASHEARTIDLEVMRCFPNYFGPQRIGSERGLQVGRYLIEGEFEKAAECISEDFRRSRILDGLARTTQSMKHRWLHPTMKRATSFNLQKWQSFLWNELVYEILSSGNVLGCREMPPWSPNVDFLYQHLWQPRAVDEDILALLPKTQRKISVEPKNLSAEITKSGWKFKFDLPPGSYATTALSQIFDLEDERTS